VQTENTFNSRSKLLFLCKQSVQVTSSLGISSKQDCIHYGNLPRCELLLKPAWTESRGRIDMVHMGKYA
jgi:hypothetical protein